MKRREFITLLGGAVAAWPLVGARAGVAMRGDRYADAVSATSPEVKTWVAAFERRSASARAWQEGRNLRSRNSLVWHGHENHLPAVAPRSLSALRRGIDLSRPVRRPRAALMLATRTIPIVFGNLVDPVGQGFVDSLSRPGA